MTSIMTGRDGDPTDNNHESGEVATPPINPLTGSIEPPGGPLDRALGGSEADSAMTNQPIPLPHDDPEVSLTTPVDD